MDTLFHKMTVEEVMPHLNTGRNGLTSQEVTSRRAVYGRNLMPQPKSKTLVEIFLCVDCRNGAGAGIAYLSIVYTRIKYNIAVRSYHIQ